MIRILDITRALADENRLRILAALRGRELCVCQIVELLEITGPTISRHLAVLRQAGLVQHRKDGRWMHYRLPESPPAVVRDALDWVRRALRGNPTFAQDRRRLARILRQDPEALCSRQRSPAVPRRTATLARTP